MYGYHGDSFKDYLAESIEGARFGCTKIFRFHRLLRLQRRHRLFLLHNYVTINHIILRILTTYLLSIRGLIDML